MYLPVFASITLLKNLPSSFFWKEAVSKHCTKRTSCIIHQISCKFVNFISLLVYFIFCWIFCLNIRPPRYSASLIAGIIDGSHIPVHPPAVDEASYLNRKQGHSINSFAVSGRIELFLGNLSIFCRLQLVRKLTLAGGLIPFSFF